MKKTRIIATAAVIAVWVLLTVFAWFAPAKQASEAERRPLAQFPTLSVDTILGGKFMEKFDDYTLDQFPLRDSFRSYKALFSRYVLRQQDNNGIYVHKGQIAELCYPLDTVSVDHALKQFQTVYDLYLEDAAGIYLTVVPDKSLYLSPESGHLAMDHKALFDRMQAGMSWAEYIDITGMLALEDYYRTDTHWRQEALLPVAQQLAAAMGVTVEDTYTPTALERPFYGVYYGQAALPTESETIYIMESPLLSACQVYNYTTDSYAPVYDLSLVQDKDPYNVYLSGPQSLLRIENPNASSDRHLVIFRDSYGSSLAPLLVQDYATVTLVDIRYIQPQLLGKYVDFTGCDVLFMYSSLVLNKNLI